MRTRPRTSAYLLFVGVGLAAACGGQLEAEHSEGRTGSTLDGGSSSGASSSGSVSPGGSSGSSSGSVSSGGSGSSSGSTGLNDPGDDGGACSPGPSLETNEPPADGACWSCIEKGCASPLAACVDDCSCNNAVAAAFRCVDSGQKAGPCVLPLITDASDPALLAVSNCILQTNAECGCGDALPDASNPGCTQTSGGGSGGNGQCTSNFGETCGAMSYQVVCACPQASCVCFAGGSTHVVDYAGCPYCPGGGPMTMDDAYTLCGFPH
jgi:hypothetical protein